jgi:phosphatidylglycerol:prolipoprotein diacylglycerol transferase
MLPEIRMLGFNLDSYSALYVLAALLGGTLLWRGFRSRGYRASLAPLLVVVALAGGFVGGKLYYVLQALDEVDLRSPRTYLTVTGTGWYGGLALASVSVILFLRLTHLPVLETLDLAAPIIPLVQAIGRVGCLLAGCCRGAPSDLPWAISYPSGWPRRAHPAQLYEALLDLCISLFLWGRRSNTTRPGNRFGLYLVLAGLVRFFVEFFRVNPKVALLLTAPQLAAVLAIISGVALILRPREGPHRGARSGTAWSRE